MAQAMNINLGAFTTTDTTQNACETAERTPRTNLFTPPPPTTQTSRDMLLVAGYLHALERNVGIDAIVHVCLGYVYTPDRAAMDTRLLYLLAEQCDDRYVSLDHSDDDCDDNDNELRDGPASARHGNATAAHRLDNRDSTYGGIYVSDLQRLDSAQQRRYCHVYELDLDLELDIDEQRNTLSIFEADWLIKFCGMTTAKDIALPLNVYSHVMRQYEHQQHLRSQQQQQQQQRRKVPPLMREYNVIFKLCGSGSAGWSDACSAVIIDETSMKQEDTSHGPDLVGFNWRLPSLPIKTGGNGVCFDTQHGLVSCGGYKSASVYALPFDGDAYRQQNYDWHWQPLPDMSETRWFPSCTFVEHNKLVAMCGSSLDHEPLSTMECFDFETQTWSNLSACHKSRKYGGLYYANTTKKLYLGGGDHATQSVEVYDFERDVWHDLPSTQLPHRYYPNLWQNAQHPQLLYISCSYSNSVECIDLRCHDSVW
eukprot:CAMPEP_0202689048 /NCGR_PEP_ID=MMETSP1385-20130828/4405_1 /ASSEMBLY_ACC=CAM_ASM_000861 /TAXON_ID=933848 /ORGANISM="Elphidium margaritaceum" /LENGTH=480 /DNA_ID=CAMNT_0049344127 /DNA_START=158 /DNA_END=1597 /DNA_ORIENTATION=+